PIALNMVSSVAKDGEVRLPISGIGGISNWRDAAEFLLLGCTTVQVCTAVMHYGFRIVEDMIDGLSNYLDEKGFRSVNEIIGRAQAPRSVQQSLVRRRGEHERRHQELHRRRVGRRRPGNDKDDEERQPGDGRVAR